MSKLLQAVVLMMLVAMAASCSAGKEYTTRVFSKPKTARIDSSVAAVRFLEIDSLNVHDDMIVVALPAESEKQSNNLPVEKPETNIPAGKDVTRTKKTREQ